MITLTARINLSENGGTINSLNSNLSGNNVSADINEVLGKRTVKIGNPFILGKSILDSGAYYAHSLPYFMSSELSNIMGNFAQSYTITISGKNITQFVIAFDTTNRAFPNSIIVDGETIYDDDPIWEINVETADTHTIEISNWNKPYSPLIITSIYADINIYIDKNNLISFNSDISDRADREYPSYGIISNSASLTFTDLDEHIYDLITLQILHSGIKIDVWLNNDVSNKQEQVCLMETRELSYNNVNRQVQLSLKDNLEEWQEIYTPEIGRYLSNGEPMSPKSAKWLYLNLYMETPKKHNMQLFEELDSKTQEVLENTIIEYPLLESGTLWDSWQKLCELCLLHIYVDNNGRTVVKYNSGN